jgi:hypothetical protein
MYHHNTILGQMLKMFSRYEFQKAVSETGTEYHARGFSSWNHFVAMLFGQLSGQDSLRGIEAGLATQGAMLYHAGIRAVHRSTLAYANEHRSHELFKKIFLAMLSKCEAIAPKHKFGFKNPLHTIDATIIPLCLSLVFKIQIEVQLVALYVMFDTASEPFCQKRSLGLAKRAVS